MPETLLIAIDGTHSSEAHGSYNNAYYESEIACMVNQSYTKSFHLAAMLPSENKYFHDGPEKGATGGDSSNIEDEAWRWLEERLRVYPRANLYLVGHSRGGHIVTNIAIRLSNMMEGQFSALEHDDSEHGICSVPTVRKAVPFGPRPRQKVHFLGLYDAVDMTTDLGDTKTIPANVTWLYHARRHPNVGSHGSWGNTATGTARNDPEHYHTSEFVGTHAAMGGAVPEACDNNMGMQRAGAALAGGFLGGVIGAAVAERAVAYASSSCDMNITAEDNTAAGEAADSFIKAGARRAGMDFRW